MAPKRSPSWATDSPVFRSHSTPSTDRMHSQVHPLPASHSALTDSMSHEPWTAEEHQRFLDGLEKYGCGQSTSVFAAWHAIAATVGTRTVPDVKVHAKRYYLQLQIINTQKRKEYLTMQQIDTRWTMNEDAMLETLVARYSDGVAYPWDQIAGHLPNKTARDIRERYQKLCYDVARIEAGQHVMMHLGRYPRLAKPSAQAPDQAATDESSELPIDCVVALTPQERQTLLTALEHVPVPPGASPDVLASVASAVAALVCASNRQPPQRSVPRFTERDAQTAIQRVIAAALGDPHTVLEQLATELQLRPLPTSVARTKPTSLKHGHNEIDLSLACREQEQETSSSISATAGFAFTLSPLAGATSSSSSSVSSTFYTSAAPSPLALRFTDYESETTRSAEELLNFKASPVHAHEPQRTSRRSPLATPHVWSTFSFSFLPSPSPSSGARGLSGFGPADGISDIVDSSNAMQ